MEKSLHSGGEEKNRSATERTERSLGQLRGRSLGLVYGMDELSSGQELWLQEVESVDYWGPTFRAIYESGCQDDFLKRLERRIEEHDSEIEKMCNHHYQGFIDSVRDLLGVREDASSLNADVVDIDKEMRASGAKVAEKAQDLVKVRSLIFRTFQNELNLTSGKQVPLHLMNKKLE